jgi:hypothetical protein
MAGSQARSPRKERKLKIKEAKLKIEGLAGPEGAGGESAPISIGGYGVDECSPRGRDELHARRVRSQNEFTATTGISNNGSNQFHSGRHTNGNDLRICLWATRPIFGGYGVHECSSRGRALRGHDTGSLKQQTARSGVRALPARIKDLTVNRQQTARSGVRALPSNVSILISRGLQKFSKNMRNTLNMNNLQNTAQVLDFLVVRKKKGVFRCISHP